MSNFFQSNDEDRVCLRSATLCGREFTGAHHGAPALRQVEGDGLAGDEHESEPAIGEHAPALQHGKEVRDVEGELRRRRGEELVDRGT